VARSLKQNKKRPSTCAYLVLNHGWPLGSEYLDGLEHVDDAFVSHPLKDDAQRHKDARATDPGTAQHQYQPRCHHHHHQLQQQQHQ